MNFRYFFLVLTALIVLGLFNGLVFLPVLLAFLGPPAEVIPADGGDAIAPPTPEAPAAARQHRLQPTTRRGKSFDCGGAVAAEQRRIRIGRNSSAPPASAAVPLPALRSGAAPRRHNSDLSLSTIAEESNSYISSSQLPPSTQSSLNGGGGGTASLFVEPQVVVETTTTTTVPAAGPAAAAAAASCQSSRCATPTQQVTTTVTAKFHVELNSATPSSSLELRPPSATSSGGSGGSGGRQSRRRSREEQAAAASAQSSLTDSLRSSLSNSVTSSLGSNEGGDPGFSER